MGHLKSNLIEDAALIVLKIPMVDIENVDACTAHYEVIKDNEI